MARKKEQTVSEYEALRGDLADEPGRLGGSEVVFSTRDKEKAMARAARRRTYTVLLRRHADEARAIFENEYRVLAERQGYEMVEVTERKLVKRDA